MTVGLEQLDQPHLVLRHDVRDDADPVDLLARLRRAQRGEPGARDGPALDPEPARDRFGGRSRVARDQPDLEAGGLGGLKRWPRRHARWIDDPHQRQQREPVDERKQVVVALEVGAREVPPRGRQHP